MTLIGTGIITARPKNIFSSGYRLYEGGTQVTVLEWSAWREAAAFEIDDASYLLKRESLLGDFLLLNGDAPLARATKPSLLRNSFEFRHADRDYRIERPSVWGREFLVTRVEDRHTVGRIRRPSTWSRRASAELPAEWPLPIRIFAFWLALVIWTRQDSA